MSLNVLVFGGSQNIGYFTSIRLLAAGSRVTFSLRNPSVFDHDETIQGYIRSGHVRLVQGDALIKEDVQRAWDEAGKYRNVDILLFTVGGKPKFTFTKGFIIEPFNLVTQSFLNVLCTAPKSVPLPRTIAITSTGLSPSSHASLPLPLKPFYGWFLDVPHKDKLGVELVASHCAGWEWNEKKDGVPGDDLMGSKNWKAKEGLPAPGSLKATIIRPAMLTDGDCLAEKNGKKGKSGYRTSTGELGGYTVSRKDVAHFVADAILNRWDEVEGKRINIAY